MKTSARALGTALGATIAFVVDVAHGQAPLEAPGVLDEQAEADDAKRREEAEEQARREADERERREADGLAPEVKPPTPKPAYSLPWQLRPVFAVNAVRSDTVIAAQDDATTVVTFLVGSLKLSKELAVAARYGWVHDVPSASTSRSALTNLALSATFAPDLGAGFRFAGSGGVVVPIAQGGGRGADPDTQKAIASGVLARSSFDNAMFGANDLGLFVGASLAYVAYGFTAQIETTFFEVVRVRVQDAPRDLVRANSTWGAHVGYFVVPELSLGAELRYQIFFVPPANAPRARRDQGTFAIGVRGHVPLGKVWFRPGIAYAHPLDDPMGVAGYRIVQVDLPFVF